MEIIDKAWVISSVLEAIVSIARAPRRDGIAKLDIPARDSRVRYQLNLHSSPLCKLQHENSERKVVLVLKRNLKNVLRQHVHSMNKHQQYLEQDHKTYFGNEM